MRRGKFFVTASTENRATVQPDLVRKVRVLHFVSGGFSGGATQVAIQLVAAALAGDAVEPLLVLRRKRHTRPERIQELLQRGLPVETVPGWANIATIIALRNLCLRHRPDVLVAHGFSEHLWGRYAGLLAGVPALVHVEHNTRERYTRWRLAQARWLARRTARIVGCGPGVLPRLLQLGFPAERTTVIANGIDLAPFGDAAEQAFASRESALLMVARFGAQKDHRTLIRAIALLRDRGTRPAVYLAGGGKARHRAAAEKQVKDSRLEDQITFCGLLRNIPERLSRTKIVVLSTHYEGMPLALIEAMAAGCAVIGTRVPGVQEIIRDGINGLLCEHEDPEGLAAAIERLLSDEPLAQRLGATARLEAFSTYARERMNNEYEKLFRELAPLVD
ncbi:MAG: glycosyltransferase [Gammaproteobacteria bacterium]|nr:glycosyltransferase [Gammaproteobacteria bacterium]NDB25966.1 glycosyltransferase [Gammaproteobacteria bacterium]NDE87587.1 glycosyltransferase [Gammaproteobacteria bacterium]